MDSTRLITVSFFANETDTTPHERTEQLGTLFHFLTTHTERDHKRLGALWSPFRFDGYRDGAHMLEASLLAFDIDDGTSPEQLAEWLRGRSYFIASTHSSTPEHWKLRVGIALLEPIPAADYLGVWHSAVETLLHGHVDGVTYDSARMYYLPTHLPGVEPFQTIVWGDRTGYDWRILPTWTPPVRQALPDLEGIVGLDAGAERRRAQGMLQKWCLELANADVGTRHGLILKYGRAAGGLVASGLLDRADVERELLDAAMACGEVQQYGTKDVERTIDDAVEYGLPDRWTPSQFGDSDAFLNAPRIRLSHRDGVAVEDADDGRVAYDVPTFPEKAMPEALRALAVETSLPTALVAGAGLSVLATSIGGEAKLQLDETQLERPIVWSALLGRNGVGKSPSIELAYAPLKAADDAAYMQYRIDKAGWDQLDNVAKKQTPKPRDPRILRKNLTGSGLLRQLEQIPDTGLRLDEMSTTLRRMQPGRDGGSLIDPGEMLSMWSGESVAYTRTGNGRGGGNETDQYVPNPTVSICGDLQTYLHELLGPDVDGMRPRWQTYLWETPWEADPLYPSRAAVLAWGALVARLLERRRVPRTWFIDQRERRIFNDITRGWKTAARTEGQATRQAALYKGERLLARTVLILVEADAETIDGALYVERSHIERAALWVDYNMRVWLAIGDADRLSLTREQQQLDPAVDRIRLYIEQQGDVDPETGRRYATAKRLLNHGVAGIRDVGTRDRAVQRYAAFFPGCVGTRTPPSGGTSTVVVWAPRRANNDPSTALFNPSTDPSTDRFNPSTDPFNPSTDPSTASVDGLNTAVDGSKTLENEPEDPPVPTDQDRVHDPEPLGAHARTRTRAIARKEKSPEARLRAAEKKAAEQLAKLEKADADAPTLPYSVISERAALSPALARLQGDYVGLDTETTGLSAHRDRLRTIQLSDGETHLVLDVWALDAEGAEWRELLETWLRGRRLFMHTYLFDTGFLAAAGIAIDPSRVVDIRTLSVLLEAQQTHVDFSLKGLAKRHLAEYVDKKEQKSGWDAEGPLRHAKLAYAAEDARVTNAIGEKLLEIRDRASDSTSILRVFKLEQETQAPTWWLASAGAPADRRIMAEAIAEQNALIAERLETLNRIADRNGTADAVNWRSPLQVLPILRDRGVDVTSTGEDALMDSESSDPIVDALLKYRSAGSCLGLLTKAQRSIQDDGRIYAAFNPIGAVTGRTSCSDPNLQNLPHETRAREAIRPGPGKVFVRADYSQLQIAIAARLSGDQEMRRILNLPNGDIHERTAAAVGCSRQEAKAINFGFLFGAMPKTFQREQRKNGIRLTDAQAFQYRQTFMATYPGIAAWHAAQAGWNRPVLIEDPSLSGRARRSVESLNMQLNTPVQMVEAHGFKRALQEIYASRAEVPSARVVMMVHDEIIAEVDADEAIVCKYWLVGCMVQGMQPLIPTIKIRVDAAIVRSYSDDDKKRPIG